MIVTDLLVSRASGNGAAPTFGRCDISARMPTEAALFRDTGEDDLNRNSLALWTEGSFVVRVENEGASRIDGIGAKDALIILARNCAGLATFTFNETNDGSAYARRANRAGLSCWSLWAGRPLITFFALLRHLILAASRCSQKEEKCEPANLHKSLPATTKSEERTQTNCRKRSLEVHGAGAGSVQGLLAMTVQTGGARLGSGPKPFARHGKPPIISTGHGA